jgi:phytoene synthase
VSHSAPVILSSYRLCRRMTRSAGSSFYPSFLPLGRAKRRAMDALYAFMRHTDDLADSREPLEARREALSRWRASLQAALLRSDRIRAVPHGPDPMNRVTTSRPEVPPAGSSPTDPMEAGKGRQAAHGTRQAAHGTGGPGDALLPALVDTVKRFAVPVEHLLAVIDGVEMDLDPRRYETFDDLVTYCQRVASAVGLACIHIWGFNGDGAFEPARKCGIALQLTNILRDLREDVEEGRVYLPTEDLHRCGYSAEDLAARRVDDRFLHLMTFQIDRARGFYREGAELFDWLQPGGRRALGMMLTVYYRLLEEIERRPGDVFRRRIRLSQPKKLGIAARWLLLPVRRPVFP